MNTAENENTPAPLDGEALRFELAARIEIRCPLCGLLAPEGMFDHDCAKPSLQPRDAERTDL